MASTHDPNNRNDDAILALLRTYRAAASASVHQDTQAIVERLTNQLRQCWRKVESVPAVSIKDSAKPFIDDDLSQESAGCEPMDNLNLEDFDEEDRLRRAIEIVREQYSRTPEQEKVFRAFEMYSLLGHSTEDIAAALETTINYIYHANHWVTIAIQAEMRRHE